MTPPEVHAVHLRLGYSSGACGRCNAPRWHDDARAGRLRQSCVGGVPLEPSDSLMSACEVPPLGARAHQDAEGHPQLVRAG